MGLQGRASTQFKECSFPGRAVIVASAAKAGGESAVKGERSDAEGRRVRYEEKEWSGEVRVRIWW